MQVGHQRQRVHRGRVPGPGPGPSCRRGRGGGRLRGRVQRVGCQPHGPQPQQELPHAHSGHLAAVGDRPGPRRARIASVGCRLQRGPRHERRPRRPLPLRLRAAHRAVIVFERRQRSSRGSGRQRSRDARRRPQRRLHNNRNQGLQPRPAPEQAPTSSGPRRPNQRGAWLLKCCRKIAMRTAVSAVSGRSVAVTGAEPARPPADPSSELQQAQSEGRATQNRQHRSSPSKR